ncbi:TetR/AcrR family transcriptional regulator [Frondihabitans sp. PAMC 28766]|uniref:TetR/AcrR family transcriptional regulator n=1 Tax=Frondihabitans sp. PAMC 28766 TaxID=1795630 RepID=UPI0012FF8E93|nr:TetR/AcrR family transcriptional regulator [Frondihabitans sp. PAMC 28766]
MPDSLPRLLRSDALDNRDRLLDAARGLFAEQGLGVPMREVARRAGVGPATLYRRFPTKQDLVGAAFDDELRECRAVVETGASDRDAWRGFRSVIVGISELNARNHAFVEAFTSDFPDAVDFAAHRAELLRLLAGLAKRAQDAGGLRSDFVLDDLVLVLLAGRGVSQAPVATRLAAARRFAALAIDGLRAAGQREPLPPRARLLAS